MASQVQVHDRGVELFVLMNQRQGVVDLGHRPHDLVAPHFKRVFKNHGHQHFIFEQEHAESGERRFGHEVNFGGPGAPLHKNCAARDR
mgnify:CR=1 FL=1